MNFKSAKKLQTFLLVYIYLYCDTGEECRDNTVIYEGFDNINFHQQATLVHSYT